MSSQPVGPPPKRRLPRFWLLYAGVAALLMLSVLELVTGANDLTSSGTIAATLIATTPIMLAGLGGLWSERAGVVNIGLEGMMILGTYGAGYFGYHYGAWAGVFGAIAMGMLGGLLHAIATVTFGVDHIISGVAINIISLGAVQYLASNTFVGLPGGGSTQSPEDPRRPGDHDRRVERQARSRSRRRTCFFVSELAALLRALCTNLSSLVLIAFLLLVLTWSSCGGPRSASGCGPAARARPPPSPWACTCCATSSSRCWSRVAWPAWAAACWRWSPRATTATARPAAAATSASRR